MKILLFTPISLRVGAGGEQDFFELALTLFQRGHTITVVDVEGSGGSEFRLSKQAVQKRIGNLPWTSLKALPSSARLAPLIGLKDTCTLARLIRSSDLVVLYQYYGTDLLVAALCKLNDVPVVCSQANPLRRERRETPRETAQGLYFRMVWPIAAPWFDAIRVLNRDDNSYLRRIGGRGIIVYPRVGSEWLIPNGFTETGASETADGLDSAESFKILVVGRMTYQKGIDTVAEIIRSSIETGLAQRKHFQFLLAGVSILPEVLASIAKQNPQSVRFLGILLPHELIKQMRTADVFLMPSRSETFGIAALEAESQGLPVVGSDIPGLRDAIGDSPGGYLVHQHSVSDFCRILAQLATMKEEEKTRWLTMRKDTSDWCRERFGSEQYDRAWEKVLRIALGQE